MIKQLPNYCIVSIFLGLFFVTTSLAQVSKDTIRAHQNYIKADSLFKKGKYKKAIVLYENAAEDFKNKSLWKRYAKILNQVSVAYYRIRDFEESMKNIELALHICKNRLEESSLEEAKAYNNKAKIYRRKSKYDQALELYQKALIITRKRLGENNIKTASLYNNLGIIYDQKGLIDTSLDYYEKALLISQDLYDQKKENELNTVYLNFAIMYGRNGLYNKAIPYYNKAIALDKEVYGLQHHYVAIGYYNQSTNYSYIGEDNLSLQYLKKGLDIIQNIYEQDNEAFASFYDGMGTQYSKLKKFDLAFQNYQKAVNIYIKNYGENNYSTAKTTLNIGGVYRLTKQYDLASQSLYKAYNIIKNLFGEDHRNMILIHKELGLLYEQQKQYEKANTFYKKNLDIALKSFGNKNQITSESYIDVARVNILNNQTLEGINTYHHAIIAATKSFEDNSSHSLPNSNDYNNVNTLLSAISGKAKAFKTYAEENNAQKDLVFSLANFMLCDTLIDKTRNSFLSVEDKMLLEQKSADIYQEAIATALALYKKTEDKTYVSNAFYFSEKNKARLLEEQLRKTKAQHFAEIPQEQLTLIEDTKAMLAIYKSKLQKNKTKDTSEDSIISSTYSSLIFSSTQKNDSLMKLLEEQYPKYHQLKYDNTIISIAEIQQQLNTNTTLIEYFVSDTIMYAFTISKNDFAVQEIEVNNLDKKILQLQNAIISKEVVPYSKLAHELYQKLIHPINISSSQDQIIIIPDGALWHLNFDLLLTERTNTKNPKDLPYLLKQKVISYANSANLLFNHQNSTSDTVKECLAFSFSDITNTSIEKATSLAVLRNTDDDLPGTRKEIKAISDIIDGTYFYGENAIETNFKKNAGQYAILHLALHGELDNENPENSKLYFTQVKDSTQDNYLYNHELYALDIPAELAVLSACKTGTGSISKGEGVMSLGRAFQYAGTKSLVLTNWDVSDETTPELMKNFYTNLKSGMTKAKALQQAKLQYLNTADVYRSDPFYWGGFYLIGDVSTINFENNNTYIYVILFGIALLITGLIYRRKRR